MNPVIYLTGAPATGKSTLCRNLRRAVPTTAVFAYSEELRAHVARRAGLTYLTEDEIRRQSAQLVTREDVDVVDCKLVDFVAQHRTAQPIVIDSHAVTKEGYGFRVTPFKQAELRAVSPDVILCLYLASDKVTARIEADPMGRPLLSSFELDLHTHLQASMAVQYGLMLDKPVYLLDSSVGAAALVDVALKRSGLSST